MISFLSKEGFRNRIVQIRKRIIELSKGKVSSEYVQVIVKELSNQYQSIVEYVKRIARDSQKLKNNQTDLQIFQKLPQGKYENEKSILYLWQIINFIIINSQIFKKQLTTLVTLLLNGSVKYQYCFSPNTIKNGLISIHNLIANAVKTQKEYPNYEFSIFQWFQLILTYYFQKQQASNIKFASYFKDEKGEQNNIDETEWIAYIFKQIFSNKYYQSKQRSFLEQLEANSKNQMTGYYSLHMVGNFFQDIIDKRVTTELVSGYQCKIKDIKEMYGSSDKVLVSFKISKYDLKWVCKALNKNTKQYNQLVREYLKSQIIKKELIENELNSRWRIVTDMIQQIMHILNCLLFIGGYNSMLQDQIIDAILQKDKELLNYFEVSYLLYRNIQATKYKTKVSLVVEMEKEAKNKLFKIANIQDVNIQEIDIKAMNLEKILAKGQLVSLLRLLSNLVHINQRAQKPFEQQVKYLHMILSLTHDSISQATMKEWAIMFIRNVSQWSQKLRSQISNIKIQMKVE